MCEREREREMQTERETYRQVRGKNQIGKEAEQGMRKDIFFLAVNWL